MPPSPQEPPSTAADPGRMHPILGMLLKALAWLMGASIAAALDLELVVIGGGIAQSGEVFFAPLLEAFDEYAGMAFVRQCQIVPAQLGYLAGISGAAAVVLDDRERGAI